VDKILSANMYEMLQVRLHSRVSAYTYQPHLRSSVRGDSEQLVQGEKMPLGVNARHVP
jgi:hypothetical protein